LSTQPLSPADGQMSVAARTQTQPFGLEAHLAFRWCEYGELASVVASSGSTTLYSEALDSASAPRDKLGRVVTRIEVLPTHSSTWEYTYDAQGRLQEGDNSS
jgi:YD repeat-containing protein